MSPAPAFLSLTDKEASHAYTDLLSAIYSLDMQEASCPSGCSWRVKIAVDLCTTKLGWLTHKFLIMYWFAEVVPPVKSKRDIVSDIIMQGWIILRVAFNHK